MMLGERSYGGTGTLRFPPWSFTGDNRNSYSFSVSPKDGRTTAKASVDDHYSAFSKTHSLTAPLHDPYLSSNYGNDAVGESQFPDSIINGSGDIHDILVPVDAQSCDQFRMFEFKVKMCSRAKSHEWTDCPFAHPAEKARRRDPRKYHYSGTACPDFRTGSCPRGDACEFAHGVFEHWLHPARYRTQSCKDGMSCKRRVCFFAHSPDQLRVLSPRAESYDGSPLRVASVSSPETVSPPISPMAANSVDAMMSSLRQLQLNKVMSMPNSPRVKIMTPPGYTSLPTTPTRSVIRTRLGYFDGSGDGECLLERVESGTDLRFRMFEKLSKENPLNRVYPESDPNTEVNWVLELVK